MTSKNGLLKNQYLDYFRLIETLFSLTKWYEVRVDLKIVFWEIKLIVYAINLTSVPDEKLVNECVCVCLT